MCVRYVDSAWQLRNDTETRWQMAENGPGGVVKGSAQTLSVSRAGITSQSSLYPWHLAKRLAPMEVLRNGEMLNEWRAYRRQHKYLECKVEIGEDLKGDTDKMFRDPSGGKDEM